MADKRYEVAVNGLEPEELKTVLNKAMVAVTKEFPPKTGVIVFAFDFGEGGVVSYASNAQRDDAITMLEEWIRHVRHLA